MEHKGTVTIRTERLLLRRFTPEDARCAFENWTNDEKVTEFLRWKPHGDISVTEEVVKGWVKKYEDKTFYHWAIVLKESDEPVGTLSVVGTDEERGMVHIGYCLGSKWWNKGYMSEALSGVIPFFFNEVKASRIESQHDPDNPGSGRVMEKCGLCYERTLKGADRSNRGIADACVYGLSAEEYAALARTDGAT